MKNLGVLVGFLPLIVFGVVSGSSLQSIQIALLAACVVAVIVGHKTLKRGFYLDCANLLMFAGGLIAISVLNITVIAEYMNIIIYLVLTLVAFGSIIAGNPFTSQYARDMIDKSLWEHPAFKSINLLMSSVWGCLFAVNLSLVTYAKFGTGPAAQAAGMLIYGVLVIGILFTVFYPEYIRKNHPFPVPPKTSP